VPENTATAHPPATRQLPAQRKPLVVNPPQLSGLAGELERITVRGLELSQIVRTLADYLAEPIAPPEAGTQSIEPRLLIWAIDSGPSTRGQLDGLARAIEQHFKDRLAVEHALVLVGEKVTLGPALAHIDTFAAEIRRGTQLGDDQFHALIPAVKQALRHYRQHAERAVILFSLDNSDVESELEPTVSALRAARVPALAIMPEVAVSDAFWHKPRQQPFAQRAAALGLTLAGSEAPLIELPWGWANQRLDPQQTIGSGYTAYAWSRLAAASAGRVYLYNPRSSGPSFCRAIQCDLCAGSHTGCDTPYHTHLLAQFEPTVQGRGAYLGLVAANTHARRARYLWANAFDAGLVPAGPPARPEPEVQLEPKAKIPQVDKAPYERLLEALGGAGQQIIVHRRDVKQAQEAIEARRQAIETLLATHLALKPSTSENPFARRAVANAIAGRTMLIAQRLIAYEQLRVLQELERAWPNGEQEAIVSLSTQVIPLCHGGEAAAAYPWVTVAMRRAVARFAHEVDPLLAHYEGSPWSLQLRRTQLLALAVEVTAIPEPPAQDTSTPRPPRNRNASSSPPTRTKPTSESKEGVETSGTERETPPPPRPTRSATSGSGTSGGASTR
jgi:hypothetical protein